MFSFKPETAVKIICACGVFLCNYKTLINLWLFDVRPTGELQWLWWEEGCLCSVFESVGLAAEQRDLCVWNLSQKRLSPLRGHSGCLTLHACGGTILYILPASSSATISLLHLFVWKPPWGWSSSSASVCVQTSCLMETPSLNIWTCPYVSSPSLMSSPSSEGGEWTSPSQRTDEYGGPNLCQRILVSFQSCAKC